MGATPRVISAGHTALLKFGVPVMFGLSAIVVLLDWLQHPRSHEEIPAIALAAVGLGAAFLAWVTYRTATFKRVTLTDDALFVSNFRREIVVPLRDVAHVKQSLVEAGLVVIDLAHDSYFGRRIHFLARRAPRWRFSQHPIVDHLRDAVAAAKKAEQPTLTAQ